MSRSGYSDDYDDDDPLALGRYRAQVNSAIRGKRGQALLRELLARHTNGIDTSTAATLEL